MEDKRMRQGVQGYYITFDGGSGTGKGTIVAWCKRYLRSQGKRVWAFEDKKLDPLRELGVVMIGWCRKHNIDHQSFLLPLFVAGRAAIEAHVRSALSVKDFVLRDRSFVSTLGYQSSGLWEISPEQIWDLCVQSMGFRIPDLAVIVDAPVQTAMDRIQKSNRREEGMGGMISGEMEGRQKIRDRFLELPAIFSDRMQMLVVRNGGTFTEDQSELLLERRIKRACGPIIAILREEGVL